MKIKGWNKIKDSKHHIRFKSDKQHIIDIHNNPDIGKYTWSFDINNQRIRELKTKKEALSYAINYMRNK